MKVKTVNKIILIDADVISHFLTGGYILLLPKIFTHPMKIIDKVYAELEGFYSKRVQVDNLINLRLIEKINFPETNPQIKKEYLRLSREFGVGESACMAVARFNENILGSSNLKDICDYCNEHSITYITTMDFLCEALRTSKMTIEECDEFLQKAKAAKHRLPVTSMANYTCKSLRI
ncbi:hypothetical protein SAMN04487996_118191 [Dyadobacter soli]|uniref:PIN domain-containing protein n=1 Tax=Dyadobacter soli TaxID=659014 RepID=A0A1G7U7X6_9BACT|nr:hypothetical protein [Dyadobacter soli]SDG43696.1 hypothetical protein SAMN04487996_118191 [Dyadobacter soli]